MYVNTTFADPKTNSTNVYGSTVSPEHTTSDSSNDSTPCWNEYCWDEPTYYDNLYQHVTPKHYEWAFIFPYLLTFIVGLVGNGLVCFAVLRNHNMRTVTNVFIVNLAVGDFMVILVCLPPTLIQDVTETWFLGTVCCKAVIFLQTTSVCVSVLTLSAIAVERWWAICYPLRFKSTLSRARKIIVLVWVVSILTAVPETVVAQAVPYQFPQRISSTLLTMCRPSWDALNQGIYHLVLAVLFYVLPMILMALTYTHIAAVLWKHEIPGVVVASKIPGRKPMLDGNRNAQDEQIVARRKAARMLIAVVIVFGICYMPVYLMNLLRYFEAVNYDGNNEALYIQSLVIHWLPYINSSLNPVIYNFMSATFRKEFRTACIFCLYGIKPRQVYIRPTQSRRPSCYL
ncbi:hypothetical protein BsWGS_02640 [Bradybaena similaris]